MAAMCFGSGIPGAARFIRIVGTQRRQTLESVLRTALYRGAARRNCFTLSRADLSWGRRDLFYLYDVWSWRWLSLPPQQRVSSTNLSAT
jgi:hypothetical protein